MRSILRAVYNFLYGDQFLWEIDNARREFHVNLTLYLAAKMKFSREF